MQKAWLTGLSSKVTLHKYFFRTAKFCIFRTLACNCLVRFPHLRWRDHLYVTTKSCSYSKDRVLIGCSEVASKQRPWDRHLSHISNAETPTSNLTLHSHAQSEFGVLVVTTVFLLVSTKSRSARAQILPFSIYSCESNHTCSYFKPFLSQNIKKKNRNCRC